MRSGLRLARAVYNAAVRPAGPEPMMTTLRSAILLNRIKLLVELLCDFFLRRQTDDLIGEFSVLEDQHRRDSADHKAARDIRVFVDVHLGHCSPAVVLGREGVNGRPQPPAGSAPFRPEVDEHDAGLHFLVEVAVGECLNLVGCHVSVSPSAGPKDPRYGLSKRARPGTYAAIARSYTLTYRRAEASQEKSCRIPRCWIPSQVLRSR